MAADGSLLLQSTGFEQPKQAGQTIAQLQQQGAAALPTLASLLNLADGIHMEEVAHALQALQDAHKD